MRRGRDPGTWAWLGDVAGLTGEGGESRFLELEHDSCESPGDYGYSGWVQFDDGEIFCVYHLRDTAPHSYIRGCWFREDDFTERPSNGLMRPNGTRRHRVADSSH